MVSAKRELRARGLALLPSRATRVSRSPRFRLCSPEIRKKLRLFCRLNIHMYPYFLFAAIHHLKSSPTFSLRPCNSVGRVTVDLIRRSWVRFPPRSKDFFFARVVSCSPLLGLTPSRLFMIMGLTSTLIYTSELILCSTISTLCMTNLDDRARAACVMCEQRDRLLAVYSYSPAYSLCTVVNSCIPQYTLGYPCNNVIMK